MRRSCGWPSRRSAPWSPSRCSCSRTRPSSGGSAPRRSAAWAWPARRSPPWSASRSSSPTGPRPRWRGSSARVNREAAIRQGIDGLWLAGIIGAVVLAVGWPLAPQIVHAFGGSPGRERPGRHVPADQPAGRARPCSSCWPGPGVLRGLQDTRTPLAVAVAANVVNVGLNAFLVLGLHWGIAGSAWGTVVAQTAAAAAYLAMVARGARRAGVTFGPDLAGLRAAAVTGRVPGGAHARAAGGADRGHRDRRPAGRTRPSPRTRSRSGLWTLLAFALDAIAIAGQAITGRYLGAGDVAGARSATSRMIGWGAVYGVVFGDPAGRSHPAAAQPSSRPRRTCGGCCPRCCSSRPHSSRWPGVVFVLDGVLIGAGDQDYLALAGLVAAAVFAVGAALVIAQHGGPGRAVAGHQPVAGGPFRHAHAAGPVLPVAGHRRGPALTPTS